MKKVLPPDVSDKQFNQALAAFCGVVGDNWVFAEETASSPDYLVTWGILRLNDKASEKLWDEEYVTSS